MTDHHEERHCLPPRPVPPPPQPPCMQCRKCFCPSWFMCAPPPFFSYMDEFRGKCSLQCVLLCAWLFSQSRKDTTRTVMLIEGKVRHKTIFLWKYELKRLICEVIPTRRGPQSRRRCIYWLCSSSRSVCSSPSLLVLFLVTRRERKW